LKACAWPKGGSTVSYLSNRGFIYMPYEEKRFKQETQDCIFRTQNVNIISRRHLNKTTKMLEKGMWAQLV
jgi:hypothetical protein